MANYSQDNRPMRVDTALGTDVLLLAGLSGTEYVSRPFEFNLDLLSTDASIKAADILRTPVKITWQLPNENERIIHGLVRRFSKMGRRDDLVSYRAEVVPWYWFLNLSHEARIHQQMSVTDIAEAVFGEQGYADFSIRCGSYPPRDYCVQYRESHFNFISRLLEEEGIFYFFEHSSNSHIMVLADANGAAPQVPGEPKVRVDSFLDQTEDVIHAIEHQDAVHAGKVTLRSYDYLQPSLSLEASLSGDGVEEVYDYPGNYISPGEGDRYARIRLEEEEVWRKLVRGEGKARNLGAGMQFELVEGSDSVTKLMLAEVSHSLTAVSPRAWDNAATTQYNNSFVAIPMDTPFRPMRVTPKCRMHGTQTALVVTPSNEEIWSDQYGRIKVQFYWDRKGEKNEKSSCWVRVATPWAGKGWGAVHLPRMGQEVVVDFLEGDPDRPIVIGSVYNAEQMPPYVLPDDVTQSGVKSRSSKEGEPADFNEIRMEDKKGDELLYIHAQKDKSVHVENNRTETVGHDESITIGDNRAESVGKDESISIGDNRTESVGKDETVTISKNRNHSIGENETLDVGKNRNETVSENRTTSIGKNDTLTVTENLTVNVDKDHKEETKKNYTLKAEKIFIEGKEEVEIKSGSASIILKKNGDIQIEGGKINIKASGDLKMKGSKIAEN